MIARVICANSDGMTALYYLVGPPASSKRTVGAAIAAQTGAALIDNRLINDPVFTALGANGRDPLPRLAFNLAGDVRKTVEEAVLAAPDQVQHIFTNWLADTESDAQLCTSSAERPGSLRILGMPPSCPYG